MATSSVLPVRHVPDAERRARLGVRHLLAPHARASDPVGVAAALVGLHATEPASVHLSCWARTPGLTTVDVDRAFYADKTLVRQLPLGRALARARPHHHGRG